MKHLMKGTKTSWQCSLSTAIPFSVLLQVHWGQLKVTCTSLPWELWTSSLVSVIYQSTQTPAMLPYFCKSHPLRSVPFHDVTTHITFLQFFVVYLLSLCEISEMYLGFPKKDERGFGLER